MNISPIGGPRELGAQGNIAPASQLAGKGLSEIGSAFQSQKSESRTPSLHMHAQVWNASKAHPSDPSLPIRIAQALGHALDKALS